MKWRWIFCIYPKWALLYKIKGMKGEEKEAQTKVGWQKKIHTVCILFLSLNGGLFLLFKMVWLRVELGPLTSHGAGHFNNTRGRWGRASAAGQIIGGPPCCIVRSVHVHDDVVTCYSWLSHHMRATTALSPSSCSCGCGSHHFSQGGPTDNCAYFKQRHTNRTRQTMKRLLYKQQTIGEYLRVEPH